MLGLSKGQIARSLVCITIGSITVGLILGTKMAIANPLLVRLSEAEISTQIESLPGWTIDGQRLTRTYEFNNFVESINFVNCLVAPAEAVAHHPDITVSYNRVTVSLTTHDAGGLTQQDFDLARTISQLSLSR
jgi:4a-hydroxytetrahydrobiopterin dehydratase